MWGISTLLPMEESHTFLVSGMLGLVTFIAVEAVSHWLEMKEEAARLSGAVVRSGLGGFLYLNILDASTSPRFNSTSTSSTRTARAVCANR